MHPDVPVLTPASPEEARAMVAAATAPVVARGGGTKWGLADPPPGACVLETRQLSGIVEYDPGEFTFTALAGTPLAQLQAVLEREGQFLPFDPPWVEQGATLGGALASAISGPCRLRYGGVRDFVLGVRFIDGTGRLARAGGRVVKNAAGFDLPKLVCGCLGRLGLVVEATFKVFPRPPAYGTLRVPFPELAQAVGALQRLLASPLEPHAADLVPAEGDGAGRGAWALVVRIGGPEKAIGPQVTRASQLAGRPGEVVAGSEEGALWRALRDLEWVPEGARLLRLHLAPARLAACDGVLARFGALRRYSVGGHVGWAAWTADPPWEELAQALEELGVQAVVVRGAPPGRVWLTRPRGLEFARRVKQALDPAGRFGPL